MAELPGLPSVRASGHEYGETKAYNSYIHQGDIYQYEMLQASRQEPDGIAQYGLCLNSAPLIDSYLFIGRSAELNAMQRILRPGETINEQKRLVLGGMGGIGKTQLALAYAQQHKASYTSVFWLNATSEQTLKSSMRTVTRRVLTPQDLEVLDNEQALSRTMAWLSHTSNTKWLLIFDNYDEPNEWDIEKYCPAAGHGSVLLTTRMPDLVRGQAVRLSALSSLEDSLAILQTRSGRIDTIYDPDAHRLAAKMNGFPLALATAGAYLRKSAYTFKQYLQEYGRSWNIDPRRPLRLQEYQDRTLYTTWNLSYRRLESDDPEAARVLMLLAYFDNQDIWYELLHAGLHSSLPTWLRESVTDQIRFDSVMRTLVEYCLVEVHSATQSYSMHNCVHDWTLGELNRVIDLRLYWYAFDCVGCSLRQDDWEGLNLLRYARVSRHAVRLTHHHFEQNRELDSGMSGRFEKAVWVARLLTVQLQYIAAEKMYLRTLAGIEKALGPDHSLTLHTINNLGLLYVDQGNLKQAEIKCKQALSRAENARKPNRTLILDVINNLANTYRQQGQLQEAEGMYIRALAEKEKIYGPNHISTLNSVNNLGILYRDQSRLDQAEEMYIRALSGMEKLRGPDHVLTLGSVYNLSLLYKDQGKLDIAEKLCKRALKGREAALGPRHIYTLDTRHCLADLYSRKPGMVHEAEAMYEQLLVEYEKVIGKDHSSTSRLAHDLGHLYSRQGRLQEAEQMYLRALSGFQRGLGPNHHVTRKVKNNLANLYHRQGRLQEAAQLSQQAVP